jgi:hypothetical protein
VARGPAGFTSVGAFDSEKHQMCSQAGMSGVGAVKLPGTRFSHKEDAEVPPTTDVMMYRPALSPLRNRATRRSEAPPRQSYRRPISRLER